MSVILLSLTKFRHRFCLLSSSIRTSKRRHSKALHSLSYVSDVNDVNDDDDGIDDDDDEESSV